MTKVSALCLYIKTAACLLVCSSTVAAEPNPAPHRVSPFGIGSATLQLSDLPGWIPQMTAIGILDLRAAGGYWNGMEPEPGKWAWDRFDKKISFLESHGVVTGGLLLGVPLWRKQDHPHGLPVNSLPEWSNYVSRMVGRYKGIKHWEVWNEPPNGTRNAAPADYAKVVVAAYNAAKTERPDCLIGLAAKSVHINYLEQVLQAGAKNHFDYITFHPYEVLGAVEHHPGTESIYMHVVPTLRKMLAAQNPEKVNVPVWFTEVGYDTKRGTDRHSNALLKAYTMGIAQGIECITWYEGKDGDDGPKGLLAADGTPRPAYVAMGQLIRHLGRYPNYLGWVLLNEKHYGFVFDGPAGPVLSTWASTSQPEQIDFGQEVTIIDPRTGDSIASQTHQLTTSPILVQGFPEVLITEAQANKVKPFPWGGDYTQAKEVSVTMGDKNLEKGLHLFSAESVAANVIAYGGNARTGDVPEGVVFVVDPNFLSYTTTPIEIQMVVRRNEKNDPGKLTLEYESKTGYKKPEPYVIPEGDDWHTATWRINDCQFVNTWAFSFRLSSGKYLLKSVVLKKL